AATITFAPSSRPTPGGQVAQATTSAPADAVPVTDAVKLLSFAAEAARAEPAVTPRADQFVYTRSDTGSNGGAPREIWLSVDGTRDGILHDHGGQVPLPGCRDGQAQVVKGPEALPGLTEPCEPRPAYRADLPTDVEGMLAYLDEHASGEKGSVNARGKDVLSLINESMLSPLTRAALYDAAARVPGLTVVPDARDAAGRQGIGITWPVPEGSAPEADPVVIVFDARSYELLGTNFHAIVAQEVVDQAGQRP
ncbi:MAG: CU044_5270 family protein, partial [Saccharothrix sp.]|nr:CU044_5270 family protein [Saccharothrix sp.]